MPFRGLYGVTVKVLAFEVRPSLVTRTLVAPAARLAGTVAVIEVALQALVVAIVLPNFTAPELKKLVPVMVTVEPAAPLVGEIVVMIG